MSEATQDWVAVGKITGLFGVKGWIKIFSYTEPRDGILNYSPWYLLVNGEHMCVEPDAGKQHGKGVIAHLQSINDRDAAARLINAEIAIHRDQLPSAEEGEYYWADLIGLKVVTLDGKALGTVSYLFETGANDVMVVAGDRERLIPFLRDSVVRRIDLKKGLIEVDWDPEF
jgi:16S rRNA processing protein RimM